MSIRNETRRESEVKWKRRREKNKNAINNIKSVL